MSSNNRPKRSCKSWKFPMRTIEHIKEFWMRVLHWIDDFLTFSPDRREGEMIPIRTDNRRAPNRKVVFFDDRDALKRALLLLLLLFLLALGVNRVAFG